MPLINRAVFAKPGVLEAGVLVSRRVTPVFNQIRTMDVDSLIIGLISILGGLVGRNSKWLKADSEDPNSLTGYTFKTSGNILIGIGIVMIVWVLFEWLH